MQVYRDNSLNMTVTRDHFICESNYILLWPWTIAMAQRWRELSWSRPGCHIAGWRTKPSSRSWTSGWWFGVQSSSAEILAALSHRLRIVLVLIVVLLMQMEHLAIFSEANHHHHAFFYLEIKAAMQGPNRVPALDPGFMLFPYFKKIPPTATWEERNCTVWPVVISVLHHNLPIFIAAGEFQQQPRQ